MESKKPPDVYKKNIKVIVITFLIYLFYPIILPMYLLILVYRQLVCVIVKRDPQIKKMMSGFDNLFSYPSPYESPKSVIITTYPLKSPVDINHVKRYLESGLLSAKFSDGVLKFPELKQRVVSKWGYSFWRQVDSFSLDNHVKYLCPDDPFKTLQQYELSKLLKIARNNFNPACSPWELLVVPNFVDPEDMSIKGLVLMRIQHCMCDGLAFMNLAHHMSLHPKTSSLNPNSLQISWNPIEWITSLGRLLYVLIKAPYIFTRKFVFLPELDSMVKVLRNSHKKTKQDLMYMESKPFSLEELKPIQNYCNVRPSSVVIGIFLEVILEAMRLKNVPIPDELSYMIPFPVPGHPGTLTNCFVTDQMVTKICLNDPLQTLKNIETSYSQFRDTYVSVLVAYICKHFANFPTTFLDENESKPNFTGLLTNFRHDTFDMFGYEVAEIGCYGAIDSNPPFLFACVGYSGKIRFYGGVDSALFDEQDVEEIKTKFNSQIKTYLGLIGKASVDKGLNNK